MQTNKVSGKTKLTDKWVGGAIVLFLKAFGKSSFPIKNENPKNIIIVKLAAIGDTILLIPILRALSKEYPDTRITMVHTAVNREVLKNCPYIQNLMEINIKLLQQNPFLLLEYGKRLRALDPDIIIDYEQWSMLTPILSRLTRAPRRFGLNGYSALRSLLYTEKYKGGKNEHELQRFLGLTRPLLSSEPETGLELFVTPTEEDNIKRKLEHNWISEENFLLVIHPGCGGGEHPRNWPIEQYRWLLSRLLASKPDIKVIITGGPDETILAAQLYDAIADPMHIVNLSGKLSLRETFVLLRSSNLVICGNTGIMHAACAWNTPVVALHGPTNPERWGPLGSNHTVVQTTKSCAPCLDLGFDYGCSKPDCMEEIPRENVLAAALKYVSPAR